jgi:hypothetical protein
MAHLWVQRSKRDPVPAGTGTDTWDILTLGAEEAVPLPSSEAAAVLLLRSRSSDGDLWLLLALTPGSVALNGVPLRSGIRVLTDQDEISLGPGGRMFFSTERRAAVQPCTSTNPDLRCARCRRPILPQSDAVACPNCTVWYHQTDRRPCWTYAPVCAMCGHASELNGTYRWTPEVL